MGNQTTTQELDDEFEKNMNFDHIELHEKTNYKIAVKKNNFF